MLIEAHSGYSEIRNSYKIKWSLLSNVLDFVMAKEMSPSLERGVTVKEPEGDTVVGKL